MTNVSKEQKGELYKEYLNDRAQTIKIQVPRGPKISFSKAWDLKDTMTQVTFKTLSKPMIRPNLTFEEIDLKPVANFKYYQVTIKR